jgi:hypothetical protein
MTVIPAGAGAVSTAAPKSLAARIVGVWFAPRATYADVARSPRWLGVVAVVAVLTGGATFAFLSTSVGEEAWIDAAVRQQEAFGRTLTDQQYERLQQIAPYARYLSLVTIVALPVACGMIAAILLGVFNAVLGGDATFRQVFAIVAHSTVLLPIAQVVGLPIAYAQGTLSSATNLGVFAPFLDENSFAARFLGAIDLVYIWWLVSLAIGLGVLYERRTAPIARSLLTAYVAIALIIAAIRTALSGA